MTIEVNVRHLTGVTEVFLHGPADREVLARVGEGLVAAVAVEEALILNLEELHLLDDGAFDALLAPLAGTGARAGWLSVVCSARAKCRERLAVRCEQSHIAIHPDLASALSAIPEDGRDSPPGGAHPVTVVAS